MTSYLGAKHWKPAVLQDLVFLQRGFDITKDHQEEGDIPVFSSSGLSSWHNEAKVHGPGVIIGRKGTLGSVHYSRGDYWPHDTTLWSKSLNNNNPRFVYYALKCLGLERFNVGGANPTLNRNHIHRLPIFIPERPVQDWIVSILDGYDDLIENNERRTALLEQAARLLYREWFVYLRFPGHEHVRVKAGIPDGWRSVSFVDACSSLEDGDWIGSKDQGGGDFRLLQISNIGVNEFVETGNCRYITEETFARLNCRELLPGHILIARMPKPIGRAWLVTDMPWRMVTAVDGAIAVASLEMSDPYFLTYFMNSSTTLAHCEKRAVGATRPRITRRAVATLPLLLPPLRCRLFSARSWSLSTANAKFCGNRVKSLPKRATFCALAL